MADIQIPINTGAPELADYEISNSVDFHIATSNFIKIVNEYGDYVAANYAWSETKHLNDPITEQAKLFQSINNGTFNAQESAVGANVVSSNQSDKKYDLIGINSYLSKNEVWIRSKDNLPTKKVEGGKTYFHAYNIITELREWKEIPDSDVTQNVTDTIEKLKTRFGAGNMNDEFLVHWHDRFRKAHHKVRQEYKSLVTDDVADYFTEFSDSVGSLGRIFEVVDNTVIPYWDISHTILKTIGGASVIPTSIPANIQDKLDDQTKINMMEAAKKVSTHYRIHMSRALESLSTPTQAHGDNLMTDHLHWTRMTQSITIIDDIVSDTLGAVYKILSYSRVAQNKKKVKDGRFDIVIENSKITVDVMRNKIQTLNKLVTSNSILQAGQVQEFGRD